MQWCWWGSNPRPLSLKSSTLPLSPCAALNGSQWLTDFIFLLTLIPPIVFVLNILFPFMSASYTKVHYQGRKHFEPCYLGIHPNKEIYERKIVIISLPINLNMCFGCSKEPSHWDGSFEYPQHMLWMRNEENSFPIPTLIWRPAYLSAPSSVCLFDLILYVPSTIFQFNRDGSSWVEPVLS